VSTKEKNLKSKRFGRKKKSMAIKYKEFSEFKHKKYYKCDYSNQCFR